MVKTLLFKIKLQLYACIRFVQNLKAGNASVFHNPFSSLRVIPQKIQDLNRHLSISLMAVLFVGGSVASSSAQSNVDLASLFPPSAESVQSIVDDVKPYTPTIQEETDQVVKSYIGTVDKNYIENISILATAEDNPLKDQGIVYTVEAGDTYSKIAQKFGLKTSSILAANGIDANKIKKDASALTVKIGAHVNVPFENIDGPEDWVQITQDVARAKQEKTQTANNKKKSPTAITLRRTVSGGPSVILASRDFTSHNGYPGGWCTAYVAGRVSTGRWGNAGNWYRAAKADGRAVGQSPRKGSIIVTRESGFGHVGVVEAVNGGQITISEMNYKGRGIISQRTVSESSIPVIGYIY